MIKYALYFTLKSLFLLKIFTFLSLLFDHAEKRLDEKTKVDFKFMTSHPGEQAIAIDIMPNISISKGNQTFEIWSASAQLIEYNKNITCLVVTLTVNITLLSEILGNMCIGIAC